MMKFIENLFPVISKHDIVVEKSWNLNDIMSILELCIYFVLKLALRSCISVISEVLKFIVILLLTYAFALGVFRLMEEISRDKSMKLQPKNKKSLNIYDIRNKGIPMRPYAINDVAQSEESLKIPSTAAWNSTNGFDSDDILDEVVRVGSFKRPASASNEEAGGKSLIGQAIEALNNARTATNASRA